MVNTDLFEIPAENLIPTNQPPELALSVTIEFET